MNLKNQHKISREIEGLRAIAIILVLLHHIWPKFLPGGYIGVDVFFVISGYLITKQLIQSYDDFGNFQLQSFYVRRARRLLPAACTVLLATSLSYTLLPVITWENLSNELLASAFYFQNWGLASQAVDYLASDNPSSPLQHYWSLSVEEQYYVFWPVLLAASTTLISSSRTVFGIVIALIGLVSFYYSLIITELQPELAYFSTFSRSWEFAMGGILATHSLTAKLSLHLRQYLAWLGLTAVVLAAMLFTKATPFPGSAALLPTIGTSLVIIAGNSESNWSISNLLRLRPIQYLGGISYSLYLWHWPIIIYIGFLIDKENSIYGAGCILLLSSLLAHLTKYYIEDRFRLKPEQDTHLGPAILVGTAFTAMVILSTIEIKMTINQLASRPIINLPEESKGLENNILSPLEAQRDKASAYNELCFATYNSSTPRLCKYGNPYSNKTVVIVGDSHAIHWLPALKVISQKDNWHLIAITKTSCSYGSAPILNKWKQVDSSCSDWNRNIKPILSKINPDVLIFSQINNFTAANSLNSVHSARILASSLATEWEHHIKSGKQVFAIKDTPYLNKDVPLCLSRKNSSINACSRSRKESIDLVNKPDPLVLAAQQVSGVQLVDLTDFICETDICPAVKNGMIIWRDRNHMTATFARSLALHLKESLESAPK